MKANSELGKQVEEIIKSGGLVPDEIVITLVQNKLKECKGQGYILDGFPRTAAQAKSLIQQGIVPTCILKLNVPNDVLVARVTGRRLDPDTGKIYHITNNPAPEDVQARLTQRPDDNEVHQVIFSFFN